MTPAETRPRVEGERELEIFEATLGVLAETGYDRLTMDAVAARAKASKATLYRRWSSKTELVVEALRASKESERPLPDEGSLRADLIATFCEHGSIGDPEQLALFSSVVTALTRDPEFAEAFRRDVLQPQIAATTEIYERARRRGEVRHDLDLALIGPTLAGILLHRHIVLGELPDRAAIERVVDQVILPAVSPTHRP